MSSTEEAKRMELTPEEWKGVVLTNLAQLQNWIHQMPAQTETGVSTMTPERMAVIDAHIQRGRAFVRAWSKARLTMPQVETATAEGGPLGPPQAVNGAKRKGGWPKGKPRTRTPKTPPAEAQS